MKAILSLCIAASISFSAYSTIYTVNVWNGYYQFVGSPTLELGDTIQWLPLDQPTMVHTITSTNIPAGAATFDYVWQAPADTFFMYIPTEIGVYDYECTPHAGAPYYMLGTFEVVAPTSASESVEIATLKVVPNPTREIVRINNLPLQTPFAVVSLTGKTCITGNYSGIIDLSGIPAGIYFIRPEGYENRAIKLIRVE